MKPSYQLIVNGENITPKIDGRLISLTLTDESGEKADQLDITLDDCDGQLKIPPRKAEIEVSIGFDDDLVQKGTFIVDELSHSGPPDLLTVRARSSDFNERLKVKREQSWHRLSLGEIITTLAIRNDLTPAVHQDLAKIEIEHIDQTNESDLNLFTRLGKKYGAIATVKEKRMLFMPKGSKATSSGHPIPPVTITRSEGDKHSYSETGRDSDYTGVQANWNNTETAKQEKVVIGEPKRAKVIRDSFPTKEEAAHAAKAEWGIVQQSHATCSLNLAIGNPRLQPETPVIAQSFKSPIDNAPWIINRVVHSLNDNGLTSKVELSTVKSEPEDSE